MQKKTTHVFWSRSAWSIDRHVPVRPAAPAPRKADVRADERAARFRTLSFGLIYIGFLCVAMFLEVCVRMERKSQSLEIWTLMKRKVEIESEITRLDMRLTALESPTRLESLASSEIGLTAAETHAKTQKKTQP